MGKKILVADDSVTIQKVIKLALASAGYDILAVSDGNEAIKAIKQENPDAVLVDMKLPGKDAFQLKTECNADALTSKINFVLMVSAFEKVDEQQITSLNFHGRLIKPFDPSHLRKVVALALEKTTEKPAATAAQHAAQTIAAQHAAQPENDFDLPPPPDIHGLQKEMPIVSDILSDDLPKISFDLNTEPLEEENLPESTKQIINDLPPLQDNQPIMLDLDPENDIRGLTQTTIEMSKLDELPWNLEDQGKMRQPPPPPPPPPAGAEAVNVTELFPKKDMPVLSGSKGHDKVGLPLKPFDAGGSTFLKSGLIELDSPLESGLSREDLEAIIRKEVTTAMERLAREEVPRIAETVIRKEIERILSEP